MELYDIYAWCDGYGNNSNYIYSVYAKSQADAEELAREEACYIYLDLEIDGCVPSYDACIEEFFELFPEKVHEGENLREAEDYAEQRWIECREGYIRYRATRAAINIEDLPDYQRVYR